VSREKFFSLVIPVYYIGIFSNLLHMQASIIWCLSQARINWEGCGRKGTWHKMGDDGGGGTDSLDWVASKRIVGACASVIFPCTIKSRRRQAVIEEIDKGFSEFCIIIGTATRLLAY